MQCTPNSPKIRTCAIFVAFPWPSAHPSESLIFCRNFLFRPHCPVIPWLSTRSVHCRDGSLGTVPPWNYPAPRGGGPEKGANLGVLSDINPKIDPTKGEKGKPFEAKCELVPPVRSHANGQMCASYRPRHWYRHQRRCWWLGAILGTLLSF